MPCKQRKYVSSDDDDFCRPLDDELVYMSVDDVSSDDDDDVNEDDIDDDINDVDDDVDDDSDEVEVYISLINTHVIKFMEIL